MSAAPFQYGLHVVGPTHNRRAPVKWAPLLIAAAGVHAPFDPTKEQYVSAFRFDGALPTHLKTRGGSTAGFAGSVWSPVLHFDLDAAADLAPALEAGRRLVGAVLARYGAVAENDLGIFYSGGRSVHVEVPLLHRPEPGPTFHATARRLAAQLARIAGVDAVPGVTFDAGNYDRVRLWRLVNSRHAKSGLHKVRLDTDELMHLSAEGIRKLTTEPRPYAPIDPALDPDSVLAEDWHTAEQAATAAASATPPTAPPERLNRATLDFIREGAVVGDRHRLLFSAAANLGEFDCSPQLAAALLMPSALDSGLSPGEALRQIECGLKHLTSAPESGVPG